MDFRLHIHGRCTEKNVLKDIGFELNENTVVLFFGYANQEIHVGEKITKIFNQNLHLEKQFLFDFDLELLKVNTGYGKSINYIPRGYKTLCLFKGSKEDIAKINKLVGVGSSGRSGWNCSQGFNTTN